MCGIAGIAGCRDEVLVQAMTRTLAHRGPDAEGFWHGDGVSLGHRRLSIIDLSGGGQPMGYADGRYQVVFNGEIYNYRELRRELQGLGWAFHRESDTEVLLAAYAAWGDACLSRFEGMFAFALWDREERRMLLARDPVGIKPLYYAEVGEKLLFGSEIKALLACDVVDRSLDYEALDDYLTWLYTMPPRTFYKGVRQLLPGHALTWQDGKTSVRRYWRLADKIPAKPEHRVESQTAEELHGLLQDIVTRHMIADVPVGAFLSGGLDSATIVALMRHQGVSPATFTVGFGDEGKWYDERTAAASMARLWNTQHHELVVKADVAGNIPMLLHHFDEPFGSPTALLTHEICRVVRRDVTVVLSGDGGDECLGGYPRYQGMLWAQYWRKIPEVFRRRLVDPIINIIPESIHGNHFPRRLHEFSTGTLLDPLSMYALWMSTFTPDQKKSLYTADLAKKLDNRDAWDNLRTLAREYPVDNDPAGLAMYLDIHTFLPNNVLQYGDRMSMAQGLEARVPFADHRLVEFTAGIPGCQRISPWSTKRLLRQSMRKELPEDVLKRKKLGFHPPMGVWLTQGLREMVSDLLSPSSVQSRGLFEPEAVQRLVNGHYAGQRDHTWHLWALLLLENWFQSSRNIC